MYRKPYAQKCSQLKLACLDMSIVVLFAWYVILSDSFVRLCDARALVQLCAPARSSESLRIGSHLLALLPIVGAEWFPQGNA
jgi:hypothetical protein